MRLIQRLAISGLLSVMLILLLTGTFVTRRDLANVVDRGVAPEDRPDQANPAWVQDNVVPDQDKGDSVRKFENIKHTTYRNQVSAPPESSLKVQGPYIILPPNPPLDDVTNQRREKVKEASIHNYLI